MKNFTLATNEKNNCVSYVKNITIVKQRKSINKNMLSGFWCIKSEA